MSGWLKHIILGICVLFLLSGCHRSTPLNNQQQAKSHHNIAQSQGCDDSEYDNIHSPIPLENIPVQGCTIE
ncbi:hypothetical protein DES39_1606 [Orbus hercynius]|uniref:Lipoprotein n=1 Tax=Orbus hercynius TaxID=593135 RepID=A0A495RC96_9GAMM|nr:hypothetical protein [Orbus hercynius]RKS85097.1 hypothetical protein DES39_1606 [Orbus hercynius]